MWPQPLGSDHPEGQALLLGSRRTWKTWARLLVEAKEVLKPKLSQTDREKVRPEGPSCPLNLVPGVR